MCVCFHCEVVALEKKLKAAQELSENFEVFAAVFYSKSVCFLFVIFILCNICLQCFCSLWRCRFGSRKGIRPVKNWVVRCWRGCLEWGADLHMAQVMPLPLTVSCSSKIQIGFTFLVPAHLDSPGQRAIKQVCVCVVIFILNSENWKLIFRTRLHFMVLLFMTFSLESVWVIHELCLHFELLFSNVPFHVIHVNLVKYGIFDAERHFTSCCSRLNRFFWYRLICGSELWKLWSAWLCGPLMIVLSR